MRDDKEQSFNKRKSNWNAINIINLLPENKTLKSKAAKSSKLIIFCKKLRVI